MGGEEGGRRALPWTAPGLASKLASDRACCPVPAGTPGILPKAPLARANSLAETPSGCQERTKNSLVDVRYL